jgi:hypothetical protein
LHASDLEWVSEAPVEEHDISLGLRSGVERGEGGGFGQTMDRHKHRQLEEINELDALLASRRDEARRRWTRVRLRRWAVGYGHGEEGTGDEGKVTWERMINSNKSLSSFLVM